MLNQHQRQTIAKNGKSTLHSTLHKPESRFFGISARAGREKTTDHPRIVNRHAKQTHFGGL
jgi:hypothetical protein